VRYAGLQQLQKISPGAAALSKSSSNKCNLPSETAHFLPFEIRPDNQGCSASKKGVGTHQKIAILKQLPAHFKQNVKRVWERRSHAFPHRYTPAGNPQNAEA